MKKYVVKKLYKGYASIRDYIVQECLKNEDGLVIEYEGKIMTIYNSQLKTFQLHTRKFISKFNNETYELVDFKFLPDEENKKQMRLF